MKLELIDQFGREQTLYVESPLEPVLTDERGNRVVDYGTMFPQPRGISRASDPPFKYIVDAFLQRPSPGLALTWLDMEGTSAWDSMFRVWREAIMVMTGKLLVRVSK
jgi:hypothetical protein